MYDAYCNSCSQNKMFYSDYIDNHIYSATLDTGADAELLLNDSVEVPGNEDIHNTQSHFIVDNYRF